VNRHLKSVGAAVVCMAVGLSLTALSVPALVYSVRATRAFATYHRVRWRPGDLTPADLLRRCDEAYPLYRHNYRLSLTATDTAFTAGEAEADFDRADMLLQAAEDWCDRGLEENGLHMELRSIKARLIAYGSRKEAVAYWDRYLDWHFWDPMNHALMVDLSVDAGDLARAEAALQWLKGSRYYVPALKRIEAARKAQALPPPASR
jgi:hypothetical protein